MSITVVFSATIGYLLGVDTFEITTFSLLVVGGFLVTGAANGFNQVIEREHDKFMERTAVRPLTFRVIYQLLKHLFSQYLLVL